MNLLTSSAALTALILLSASSLSADTRVYVHVGPPAPRHEVVVVAPGPGYVWVPGYYTWSGSAYVWGAGHYVRPPRPGAVWVAPHWVHHQKGWYVVQGGWR
jgi:WXXGXW repeat (2 copies)